MEQSIFDPQEIFNDILFKLLNEKIDKFEILEIAGKFSVDISVEESFSKQKYIIQKFVLEQLMKVETEKSRYFSRLLEETDSHLNLSKTGGYLCCLVGCLFSAPRHRFYIQHLKSVHHNYEKLVCNFKKYCKREFPSLSLLLAHVQECHSLIPSVPGRQIQEDVLSKCELTSCRGKKFRNVDLLMTHINVKHAREERSCIFDQCSKKFSAGSNSRHHFRLKHKNLNQIKLKAKHLVEKIEDPTLVEESTTTIPIMSEVEDYDEVYNESDSTLFVVEGGNISGEPDRETESSKKYFQMQYCDFLNSLCNFKFIPAKTVTQIANEYLQNSLKSKSVREQKLRTSLNGLPNITESQIEKIVYETIYEDEYLKAQTEFLLSLKETSLLLKTLNLLLLLKLC